MSETTPGCGSNSEARKRAAVTPDPTPAEVWASFPGNAPVCRACGTDWQPVRRGECVRCGDDAGPLKPAEDADEHPEHTCDTGYFDRTICPEPCGMMHSFCTACGKRADSCAHHGADERPEPMSNNAPISDTSAVEMITQGFAAAPEIGRSVALSVLAARTADLTRERDEARDDAMAADQNGWDRGYRWAERELTPRAEAAEQRHRDLVSRLGFGDNITEPMADNDTIVAWFEERGQAASEWDESQLWRNDCYAAGHSDSEDCWEHDPRLRLEAAEQRADGLAVGIEALHRDAGPSQGYFGSDYVERDHCCGTCGSHGEYGVEWPCATRALLSADHTQALAERDAEKWDEGYAFGYWQDRGYSHHEARTLGIPDHLRAEVGLVPSAEIDDPWNPYRLTGRDTDGGA